MSAVEEFDLVVLGSGEGGKFLAWTLAKEGKRVAMVERQYIGGSCPNIACLPSKNVIHSAKVAQYVRRAGEFGVRTEGFRVDMAAVTERKRTMVKELVAIHVKNYTNSGTDLIMGTGKFIAPRTLEVSLNDGGTRVVRGTNVVIGTGTRAAIDATPGLREAEPMTHVEALELQELPEHLIVLGGGYIGLEFAQAMRRFGSRVTVLERNARLVHREDEDVAEGLRALFEDEGIDIVFGAQVKSVAGKSGDAVQVTLSQDGVERVVEGTHLLVATGRTPVTEGLGLEVAGVALAKSGYIQVNERLQTTAEGVWAIGEAAGSPQFTHISFDDFRIIRANLAGGNRVTTGRQVPFCMFTDPEFAHIGLSETDAKAGGISYRLLKIPMAADLRTRTISETRGFMKALIAADSDAILGFTAFGVDAGEILAVVQMAMIGKLPYTAIRDAVITHPTLAEGLTVLFAAASSAH